VGCGFGEIRNGEKRGKNFLQQKKLGGAKSRIKRNPKRCQDPAEPGKGKNSQKIAAQKKNWACRSGAFALGEKERTSRRSSKNKTKLSMSINSKSEEGGRMPCRSLNGCWGKSCGQPWQRGDSYIKEPFYDGGMEEGQVEVASGMAGGGGRLGAMKGREWEGGRRRGESKKSTELEGALRERKSYPGAGESRRSLGKRDAGRKKSLNVPQSAQVSETKRKKLERQDHADFEIQGGGCKKIFNRATPFGLREKKKKHP